MLSYKNTKTAFSSPQAGFVTVHSSGNFLDKSIRSHRLYTIRICIRGVAIELNALFGYYARMRSIDSFLWRHEDTSSLCSLSDDNSGRQRYHTTKRLIRYSTICLCAHFAVAVNSMKTISSSYSTIA